MEEERRLFYVALTRAKEELFLITEQGNESLFIDEIPGEFVDRDNFLILNIQKPKIFNCKKCYKEIEESYNYCPYCGVIKNETINLDEDSELFEKLRIYRLKKAQEKNIPPFCIFHDKTLHEIARIKPSSKENLKKINGLGDRKIEEYSEDILTILTENNTK